MDPEIKDRGNDAEERAARFLRGRGFDILARNVRTRSGEIDIVAREGPVVVIVEVKYRSTNELDAWKSLSFKKRTALIRAAREARTALRIRRGVPVRFDVVLACADGALTHLRGALPASRPYEP